MPPILLCITLSAPRSHGIRNRPKWLIWGCVEGSLFGLVLGKSHVPLGMCSGASKVLGRDAKEGSPLTQIATRKPGRPLLIVKGRL